MGGGGRFGTEIQGGFCQGAIGQAAPTPTADRVGGPRVDEASRHRRWQLLP
jgi:hypothetical protein